MSRPMSSFWTNNVDSVSQNQYCPHGGLVNRACDGMFPTTFKLARFFQSRIVQEVHWFLGATLRMGCTMRKQHFSKATLFTVVTKQPSRDAAKPDKHLVVHLESVHMNAFLVTFGLWSGMRVTGTGTLPAKQRYSGLRIPHGVPKFSPSEFRQVDQYRRRFAT